MAASDKFEITVHGKGGHGAAPQGRQCVEYSRVIFMTVYCIYDSYMYFQWSMAQLFSESSVE